MRLFRTLLPFPLQEEVCGDDEGAAEEELGGEGFVGVVDGGPGGDEGGEEKREEGGEDRFGAVDDRGFGGGDEGLPAIHGDEGSDGAEDDNGGGKRNNAGAGIADDHVHGAAPGG